MKSLAIASAFGPTGSGSGSGSGGSPRGALGLICPSFSGAAGSTGVMDGCGLSPVRQRQVLRWSCAVLMAVALVSGWAYGLVVTNRCRMDANLYEMLMYSTEKLEAARIPFWLEYGTLLGAIRDHAIVPWEYDVDLAVTESDCARVLELRDVFAAEKGFKMYGRGEFIPEKASLFGLVGGTITAPCVRVYPPDAQYPLDIYWSREFTHNPPSHVTPSGDPYIPPPDKSFTLTAAELGDNQILCDYESLPRGSDWNDHHSACRWRTDMFPLSTATMYGRTFPVPRHARKILTQTFGADWMTPRPKGYKALLCPPVWHSGSGAIYAVVCAGAAAAALAVFVYLRFSYSAVAMELALSDSHGHGSGHSGAAVKSKLLLQHAPLPREKKDDGAPHVSVDADADDTDAEDGVGYDRGLAVAQLI